MIVTILFCRTNPHANVRLSGKKKRKLIKEARRLVNEGLAMEGIVIGNNPVVKTIIII